MAESSGGEGDPCLILKVKAIAEGRIKNERIDSWTLVYPLGADLYRRPSLLDRGPGHKAC
jgi:hypothetical protein